MDALTTFRLFAAEPAAIQERLSRKPEISREVEYYQENIGSIKSIDDLIADQQVFSFVMKAYGLEEMTYAKGFIRKLLEGGVDELDSMANRLSDKRYLNLATDFNFERYGTSTTAFERTQSGTVEKYYQQQIEAEAGSNNSGARLAIYFQRKSSEISDAYSILSDRALLKFVQHSFNLPVTMSYLSLEKQSEMIDRVISYDKLNEPESVDRLVNRFLVSWDVANPDIVSVPPLISAPGEIRGISQSLLASIQNLNSRG